jgi:hypothetical protein
MNGDAPIVMSVKAAIAGGASVVVAAALALWAVLTFTLGGIGNDVANIKDRLAAVQDVARDVENTGKEADVDIRQALNSIDKNVAVLTEQTSAFQSFVTKSLDNIQAEVVNVRGSVDKLYTLYEGLNVRLVRVESGVDTLTTFASQPPVERRQIPEQDIPTSPAPLPQPQ